MQAKWLLIALIIGLVVMVGIRTHRHDQGAVAGIPEGKLRPTVPQQEVRSLPESLPSSGPEQAPPKKSEPIIKDPASLQKGLKPANLPTTRQPAPAQPPKKDRELQDPVARVALAWVGIDRDAEEYWLESIFDTTLPDKERDDLMEDLNEEGLADPHHPNADDLPLIIARLQIIEEVAPWADEFMSRHLAEAYKDLSSMLDGSYPQ